jgi:anaerobic selenocysteine-containing dehydrogenase
MWWIAAKLVEGLENNLLPQPLTTESSDLDILRFIASRAAAPFDEIQQRRYIAHAPIFGWVLDRVLPGGKWRLVPDELVTQFKDWQAVIAPLGLLITSRRQPKHLNSQHLPHHSGSSDLPFAIINTSTALGLGIKSGDDVIISTENGELRIAASLNDELHADVISLPHGWRDTNVSLLTSERDVDPLTGMVIQTAFSAQLRAANDR